MPKLSIEDLKVTYGPIVGTDGVALTLEAGETLALIGSNGAGKSSTLKAIWAWSTYTQGRITLDGDDLKGLKPFAGGAARRRLLARGAARVPAARRCSTICKVGGITRAAGELPERIERIYGYFPRLKERARQRAGGEASRATAPSASGWRRRW